MIADSSASAVPGETMKIAHAGVVGERHGGGGRSPPSTELMSASTKSFPGRPSGTPR